MKSFEFEKENSWNIPSGEVYESKVPEMLDIGSISDDWGFLSMLLQSKNEPASYQLTQLAPL